MPIANARRLLGCLGVTAVLLASCVDAGSSPETSTTTSPVAPTTTAPEATTTTTLPRRCDAAEVGVLIDIDTVAPPERAFVASDGVLVICSGSTELAAIEVEPDTIVLGIVDLDDVPPAELLLQTNGVDGSEVRLARTGLGGVEITGVLAEHRPGEDGSFSDFECADVDDDGANELLSVAYRSAGTDSDPTRMNIRIGVATFEGTDAVIAGIDSYELSSEDAHSRYEDRHRCEPGAGSRISFTVGIDGWAILDPGTSFEGPGDSLMTAIAVDATGRYVAVGAETPNLFLGEFFETRPAIWWSDDSRIWTRVDLGDATGDLRDVAALPGGGFVAAGRSGQMPSIWRSDDGVAWEQVSIPIGSDDVTGQFETVMSSVTANDSVIVGVGVESYVPTGVGPGEDLDPAVWLSIDGVGWERVVDESLGTPGYQPNTGSEFNGELVDVAHVPGIGFVAVGSASLSDPNIDYPTQTPAVWVSADGRTWERHDIDADARLRSVFAGAGGAVVAGVTDVHGGPASDAVVLTTTDGGIWEVSPGPFAGVGDVDGIQTINAGLSVPDLGVVAIGSDEAESESRGAAAVWWFNDNEWRRQAHDSRVFGSVDDSPTYVMTDAVWNGSLVVVGFTGRSIELPGGIGTGCCVYEPAVWVWNR